MNIPCPKCGFESPESAKECSRCGIVFGKWTGPSSGLRPPSPRTRGEGLRSPEPRLGRPELKILAIGLALAILATWIPLTRVGFGALGTLVHELGHAIAGWLFGYPSIPSFDFVYGGGITPTGAHQIAITLLVAGGFAYLGYMFRSNRRTTIVIGACFLVWFFFEISVWRREMVMSAVGHLSECIFAGIFMFMALSGIGWRIPEVERPLGAFVAFFLEIRLARFCLNLMHDQSFVEEYKQGKGGMLMHDIDAISSDLTIHTAWHPSIQTLATLLLLFSFVPITAAFLVYVRRAEVGRVLTSFYAVQADGPGGG